MNDWEHFIGQVPWFLEPDDTPIEVGESAAWHRGPIDGLPQLSALLAAATVTPVRIAGKPFELLAWGPFEYRRGWLCLPPRNAGGAAVAPVHRGFWQVCGGIVERFGEPAGWSLNQNDILTAEATQVSISSVLTDYAWIWADADARVPIRAEDHYVAAVEANGNLTIVHRADGRLILFAPDHSFAGVTPLPGCPPYSLMSIDGVPDLTTWIEAIAAAWRRD